MPFTSQYYLVRSYSRYVHFTIEFSSLYLHVSPVVRSACANPDLSLRWITNNSNHCLSLNSITPDATQTGENTEVVDMLSSIGFLDQFLPNFSTQ